MDQARDVRRGVLIALLAGCAALLYWVLIRAESADFSVYWWGVKGVLDGNRPMYGRDSGMGFPMHYRYPPLFTILFYPVTLIPLRIAAGLWTFAQGAAVGVVTMVAVRKWRLKVTLVTILGAAVLFTPHLVWSLKYGNVQWLVIAAIFVALLTAGTHPVWAGSLLALAIAIKVWPVFFVPWFVRPERRRASMAAVLMSAVFWTLPMGVYGPGRYQSLLRQWFSQEAGLGFGAVDTWYPSLSMRGVLLRYFTTDVAPDKEYPDVHVAALPPARVVAAWAVVSALLYGAVVWNAYRAGAQVVFLWDAAAFAMFSMLQPFCHKGSMLSLWPAILAAAPLLAFPGLRFRTAKIATGIAVAIAGLELVAQTRYLTRLFEMLGAEFYLMLALLVALIAAARSHLYRDRESTSIG